MKGRKSLSLNERNLKQGRGRPPSTQEWGLSQPETPYFSHDWARICPPQSTNLMTLSNWSNHQGPAVIGNRMGGDMSLVSPQGFPAWNLCSHPPQGQEGCLVCLHVLVHPQPCACLSSLISLFLLPASNTALTSPHCSLPHCFSSQYFSLCSSIDCNTNWHHTPTSFTHQLAVQFLKFSSVISSRKPSSPPPRSWVEGPSEG